MDVMTNTFFHLDPFVLALCLARLVFVNDHESDRDEKSESCRRADAADAVQGGGDDDGGGERQRPQDKERVPGGEAEADCGTDSVS